MKIRKFLLLFFLIFLFAVNIFAAQVVSLSDATTAVYNCSNDASCYYTDGFVKGNYLYAINLQYGIDIFNVSSDSLNLIKKNILDIKPLGAFVVASNYLITGTDGQGYIAIVDISNVENPKLVTKIFLENKYNTVLSIGYYNSYIYIWQYHADKIYYAKFDDILNSGGEADISDTNIFKTINKEGPFYLIKNYLVLPSIAGSYKFFNLDDNPDLTLGSAFEITPGIEVANMLFESNYLIVQGISYTVGGGSLTYIYNFDGINPPELFKKLSNALSYLFPLDENNFYSISQSSDYTKGYIDFYNKNFEKIFQYEYSLDADFPGILEKIVTYDSSHVIAFFGTSGIRVLKFNEPSNGISSENNCSVYDFNNNAFFLPCVKVGENFYSFDMVLFDTVPDVLLGIDLKSLQQINPISTENCANFDLTTFNMNIPCLKIENMSLNLNLYLYDANNLNFQLTSYNINK